MSEVDSSGRCWLAVMGVAVVGGAIAVARVGGCNSNRVLLESVLV